jgi:hypothetical protein
MNPGQRFGSIPRLDLPGSSQAEHSGPEPDQRARFCPLAQAGEVELWAKRVQMCHDKSIRVFQQFNNPIGVVKSKVWLAFFHVLEAERQNITES